MAKGDVLLVYLIDVDDSVGAFEPPDQKGLERAANSCSGHGNNGSLDYVVSLDGPPLS